jgi:carbamoyl-phosphate synthase large subunit
MRVFVSGGAGVIGRHLIPILIKMGHTIVVGDLQKRPIEFPPEVIYLEGDLNSLTVRQFNELQPEVLIHLAATFERSHESASFWSENFTNNVLLSNHLMSLAKSCFCLKRTLFASSYLVYDPTEYIYPSKTRIPNSLGAGTRLKPRNLIGAAKLYHENELDFLRKSGSVRFSIVVPRIYRGYGLGSRDVISRWVRSALKGERITVFDAEGSFDYIYCKDSARAIYELAFETSYQGTLDLGTGRSEKISKVLEIIQSHFPDLVAFRERDSEYIECSKADVSTIHQLIGWRPVYSLERGIHEIIAFEMSQN